MCDRTYVLEADDSMTLVNWFDRSHGEPVLYRGQVLYRKLPFMLAPGQSFNVRIESFVKNPEQSLEVFSSERKSLQILSDRGDIFKLIAWKWPDVCQVTNVSKHAVRVALINAWTTEQGHYCNISNACMLIDELSQGEWRLRFCHGRPDGPKFDSLVARVKLEQPQI